MKKTHFASMNLIFLTRNCTISIFANVPGHLLALVPAPVQGAVDERLVKVGRHLLLVHVSLPSNEIE